MNMTGHPVCRYIPSTLLHPAHKDIIRDFLKRLVETCRIPNLWVPVSADLLGGSWALLWGIEQLSGEEPNTIRTYPSHPTAQPDPSPRVTLPICHSQNSQKHVVTPSPTGGILKQKWLHTGGQRIPECCRTIIQRRVVVTLHDAHEVMGSRMMKYRLWRGAAVDRHLSHSGGLRNFPGPVQGENAETSLGMQKSTSPPHQTAGPTHNKQEFPTVLQPRL